MEKPTGITIQIQLDNPALQELLERFAHLVTKDLARTAHDIERLERKIDELITIVSGNSGF
jgi:hypothetical protein